MLGSAIPRRWVFSLALVGLVTIFAVSYSAVWSSPANADSQGPGSGSGDSVARDDDQILESAETLPTGLVLQPGQEIQVTVNLIDATGAVNDSLSDLTFVWSSTGGVSVLAGGSSPTVSLKANSTGTASVTVEQVQESRSWIVIRDMDITVSAGAATATPAPAPTNPGTPPASIPNSQGVVTPEGSIMVSSNGVESGSSPQSVGLGDIPVIRVPVGAVNNFYGLQVNTLNPADLPALPSNFQRGSSAASITFVDGSGVAQSNFRLLRSAEVCMPTNAGDLVNGFGSVKVLRYNSVVGQWVELNSTFNNLTGQVCANSSNFSNFAVGVKELPATPGAEGPGLPATGGWSPTSSLLLVIGILGVGLVGGGAISMRRARSAARPE